jgi:hypothetical protein
VYRGVEPNCSVPWPLVDVNDCTVQVAHGLVVRMTLLLRDCHGMNYSLRFQAHCPEYPKLDSCGVVWNSGPRQLVRVPTRPGERQVSTTLTAPVSAGGTSLPVASTVGFSVGCTVEIEGGGNSETGVVASIGSLVLTSGLTNSYPAATTVNLLSAEQAQGAGMAPLEKPIVLGAGASDQDQGHGMLALVAVLTLGVPLSAIALYNCMPKKSSRNVDVPMDDSLSDEEEPPETRPLINQEVPVQVVPAPTRYSVVAATPTVTTRQTFSTSLPPAIVTPISRGVLRQSSQPVVELQPPRLSSPTRQRAEPVAVPVEPVARGYFTSE